MKHAAIDIGSNAVRLLIGSEDKPGIVEYHQKMRSPIRLGSDVFSNQKISNASKEKLSSALVEYKSLMDKENIASYRAVATSAFREAKNGTEIATLLENLANIKIDIIEYQEEADLIYKAVSSNLQIEEGRHLIMDIGGGSVEFMHFSSGVLEDKVTFPLGTVRTLIACVSESRVPMYIESFRNELRSFVYDQPKSINKVIGTGGNLDAMCDFKKNHLKGSEKLRVRLHQIHQMIDALKNLSLEERINKYGLREDRADVIIPALYTTQMLMEVCGANRIYTPGVGLKEGLLYDLIDKEIDKKTDKKVEKK